MSHTCSNQPLIEYFLKQLDMMDYKRESLQLLKLKCENTTKNPEECKVFDKLIEQNHYWRTPINDALHMEILKCNLQMSGIFDSNETNVF